MIMMSEEDVALKVPERVFEGDKCWFPLVIDLKIGDHLVKVLVPIPSIVSSQRSSSVVHLRFLIENTGDENHVDSMICARFFPAGKQLGEEGMDDLLGIAFTIARELPEFLADLDKDGDFRGK